MKLKSKINKFVFLTLLLWLAVPVAAISEVASPVGTSAVSSNSTTVCAGIVLSETSYTNRWIDAADGDSGPQQVGTVMVALPPNGAKAKVPVVAPGSDLKAHTLGEGDMAGEIRYEEELNAVYGTTQYVKQFDAETGKEPTLDVDTNITFVVNPTGGRMTSNEKVGLTVVSNGVDTSGTPPVADDVAELCPWVNDSGPESAAIPAKTEAVAMGSNMNVAIVQANTAATVDAAASEPAVSYDINAAGPLETGGYGVGTISAEMIVKVQEGGDKVGWDPGAAVYVGPENPTAEQLADPKNYEVPATVTAPSQIEYQKYQDSLTSSGVWMFSKEMEYISEN
jgi:hypothetical protein